MGRSCQALRTRPYKAARAVKAKLKCPIASKVEMSGFGRPVGDGVLGWVGPRGVAPERMPKADATGLAPKNRRNPCEALTGVFFVCRA